MKDRETCPHMSFDIANKRCADCGMSELDMYMSSYSFDDLIRIYAHVYPQQCPDCNGSGRIVLFNTPEPCTKCSGKGTWRWLMFAAEDPATCDHSNYREEYDMCMSCKTPGSEIRAGRST